VLAVALWQPAGAQTTGARPLITGLPDAGQLVRLAGNTPREASAGNNRGRVPDALPMEHMQLLLRRPPERETGLKRYIGELHDPRSASFHRWLTPSQLAQRYGLAPQDLNAITTWLRQQGFKVNAVNESALIIDFSGTAGQVLQAFHTEIHRLAVGGKAHIANMSDPAIPSALAPAIAGIVSLHDLRPHPLMVPRARYTTSSGALAVVPADLATIYNLSPLFSAGTSGQGQTVVVIENTNVFSSADWTTFRSTFGLSSFTGGSFSQVHPTGTNTCSNPGVVAGNEREAELDAEWASAAAPSAAIVLASCADSTTTFGGLIALQNLVSGSNPPAIISISYGLCEADMGLTANAAFATVYQQAVALGISVFVAAGDEGAAGCDSQQAVATHGIAVSGFASTPYNVAVGGTDFGDAFAGTTGTYWSSTNGPTFGSALSYVPEIPWNDSCASSLIATAEGFAAPYGTSGFCNSSTGEAHFLTTSSGSGGPSSCAVQAAGGGCQGYPKPPWQAGLPGNPADGVRDLPDVSLFAANGVWGHYYVYCDSDTQDGGAACSGAPSGWSAAGGTSFSAPIMAGIQALVNQSTGSRQGNPNSVYYALAAGQAASTLNCNSSSGSTIASRCLFQDVTQGDMDVNCRGSINCYLPSGTNGVLSLSNGAYQKAYAASGGWDFATGIGSVNASNLVKYWGSADLTLTGGGNVNGAGLLAYTWQVGNTGPQSASGTVLSTVLPPGFALIASASSPGCSQSGANLTCTIGALAVGASAGVTIVIQPAGGASVSLSFVASSTNTDVDPNQATVTVSLALPQPSGATDGPLPLWANLMLGCLLMLLAMRGLKRGAPRTVG
jgi:subtilase family serine protease